MIRGEEEGAPAVLTAAEKPLMARLAGLMPPAPACPVDDELEEGDGLPTAEDGQDAAVVLAVLGHTTGSIAVHLPGERVILTGDLMANFDGRITLGPFNTDREQARESVLRLAALDVEAAGFGHGEPITRNASAVLADWTDVFA